MLFRQIEYFQAIIETGNFYQAAEKCNVSQSAISQQIKKLEQELGVKLLDRHNRTFSLTPAGEHFYRKSLILISDRLHYIPVLCDFSILNSEKIVVACELIRISIYFRFQSVNNCSRIGA